MKIILKFFLLSFIMVCFNQVLAEQTHKVNKWQVLDIPFKIEKAVKAPFNVQVGAVLTHEGGSTLNIPVFYNDDHTWILRFCPEKEGRWTFMTYSSLPELAGKTGSIQVDPNKKADEHGPVVISKKNPTKFVYADGTPYFLLAFELDWLFALDCENKEDIPKTREIISHVVENGFNQVVMNVYAYDAGWGEREKAKPEHRFDKPKVFPFGGSNENPDYSTLNIDFFKHLDRVMMHLDEQEIISHLMIYVWNKKVNWPEPESEADHLYFDYVVKRYQAFPNLIWDISKEALAYGRDDMNYITRRIDRLRKLDGYGRLLSVHDYAYCAAFPKKVDFISIQDWRPNLFDTMLNAAKSHSNQPVFNIEHGGYEKTTYSIFNGAYTDPVACLDRNYQCLFAGTYSTYYWQNTSWYNVIYNPSTLKKQNRPAFQYYQHLADLFKRFDFTLLEPAQDIFTPACLTDRKSVYLFYIPEYMIALHGDVPALKGKTVKAQWFNPLTGAYLDAGRKTFENGSWLGFHRPEALKSPIAVVILEIINQ